MMNSTIAILVPCHNEELTITTVVNDFRRVLPQAIIYVYDNLSNDNTAEVAKKAGATVYQEKNIGKGNVIRRMFADIEADIYIMVDGDNTYEAQKSAEMVDQMLLNNLDMIVGVRKTSNSEGEYRKGHIFGNWMLTAFVSLLFGSGFSDMLSGYRVMSRRFVKSFPAMSKGFEIETEITVHALQLGVSYAEEDTIYNSRPEGSESKLNTLKDGIRILSMITLLFKEEKPFYFFSILSLFFFMISLALSLPVLITYLETGLVPRIPTAILSTGLMIISFLCLVSGVILDSLSRSRLESKRLSYLQYNSPKQK
jgi:glycosyltransferase involved in cell wall biosynthesis